MIRTIRFLWAVVTGEYRRLEREYWIRQGRLMAEYKLNFTEEK